MATPAVPRDGLGLLARELRAFDLRAVVRRLDAAFRDHDILTYASAISFRVLYALIPLALFGLGLLRAARLPSTPAAPAGRAQRHLLGARDLPAALRPAVVRAVPGGHGAQASARPGARPRAAPQPEA